LITIRINRLSGQVDTITWWKKHKFRNTVCVLKALKVEFFTLPFFRNLPPTYVESTKVRYHGANDKQRNIDITT
jgi:hypothetical protein